MAMKQLLLASLSLLPLLASCTVYDREFFVGHDRLTIAKVDRGDGATENYVLEVGQGRVDATLTVRTEYDRERAFLGLRVAELDKRAAEPRGVEPWTGLLVTGTYPRSAAADAGLMTGDIVLAIGGTNVVHPEQVARAEASLRVADEVEVRILRGRAEQTIPVKTKGLKEHVVEPEAITLEQTTGRRPYAGVVLRGIPRVWCERMYGTPRNAVVIASVDVGSPAWVAGFRAGDVIDRVDGQPVGTVDELGSELHRRGTAGGSVSFDVSRGPEDTYGAAIQLADYTSSKQVWFPLLFHVQDGSRTDKWSVGPFGLIAHNKNEYVSETEGRAPQTRNEFDALLGAIHVESTPRGRSLQLLWIIHIDL